MAVSDTLKRTLSRGSQQRADGWVNPTSGQGTTRDKSRGSLFYRDALLSPVDCENLYVFNDLAATIVDAIVDDALREGFTLEVEAEDPEESPDPAKNQEKIKAITAQLSDLDATAKIREGAIWGRLYGGRSGVAILGPSGLSTPLTHGEAVVALIPVDRQEITPASYYTDALDPLYGTPQTYQITPKQSGAASQPRILHASRLIEFRGDLAPKSVKVENEGCDLSVLQRVYDTLRTTDGNWQSVCAMLQDMSQSVIKLKGLIDSVSAVGDAELSTRMAKLDTMRSVYRSIVLDSEGEDFSHVERSALAGIPDLVDRSWTRLAAAARMPVTRLYGLSPAGMNATGESDRRFWYDRVRAYRLDMLAPAILELATHLDPSTKWRVCFPDLEKPTPEVEADRRLKVANADKIYLDAGVVLPQEVAISRWGSGKFSPETTIDLEPRETSLESDLEDMEDPPDDNGGIVQGPGLPGGGPQAQNPVGAGQNPQAPGRGGSPSPQGGQGVGGRVGARRQAPST